MAAATQIVQHFRSSYRSNVLAKLANFRRRNVWGYLLGGLLLGASKPDLLGNFWLTAGGSSLAFCVLGLGAVCLGAYLQRNQVLFSATVAFEETSIRVQPDEASQPAETKSWAWILAWHESPTHLFLRIKRLPQLFLLVRKAALTPAELATLRRWLARPRPAV